MAPPSGKQMQVDPTRQEPTSDNVRLWIAGSNLSMDDDLGRVAEALDHHPELAQEIVEQRPMRAPLILQQAFGRYGIATLVLQTAIRREFSRTNGDGANADLLFRATLRLEGPHASELQRHMRELVAEYDRKSSIVDGSARAHVIDPVASKGSLASLATEDPALGRLYSRFVDLPDEAAAQLLLESNRDATLFARHVRRLPRFVELEMHSTQAFVRAVNALKGDGAVNVKLAVAEAVRIAAAPDIAAIEHDVWHPLHRTESDARLEVLVPLLAEIVSQPDVAHTLVKASHSDSEEERDKLRKWMELLLSEAYDATTRVRVQTILVTSTGSMLDESARLPPGAARNAAGETAGSYLGAAARTRSDAAKRDDAAAAAITARTKEIVAAIKLVLPSQAKTGLAVGQFLFDSKPASHHHGRPWSPADLDKLLVAAYGAAHPRPPGPDDNPAVRAYDDDYLDWRRLPAQDFQNQIGEPR